MPEESLLVGYADDVATLVAGRTVEQAQSRLGILMRRVSGWMATHGFNLALEKAEVVISKRIQREFRHSVMVIAGMIPVALLAKDRQAIYKRKGDEPSEVIAREERQRTLDEWQRSWENKTRGRWTARLIDNLSESEAW